MFNFFHGNIQGHHDAVAVLLTADIVGDQRVAALHVAVDKGDLANITGGNWASPTRWALAVIVSRVISPLLVIVTPVTRFIGLKKLQFVSSSCPSCILWPNWNENLTKDIWMWFVACWEREWMWMPQETLGHLLCLFLHPKAGGNRESWSKVPPKTYINGNNQMPGWSRAQKTHRFSNPWYFDWGLMCDFWLWGITNPFFLQRSWALCWGAMRQGWKKSCTSR